MGVAAYNRGSAVISRQIDSATRRAERRADRSHVKRLYREALAVQRAIVEDAQAFRRAYRRRDWRKVRALRRVGRQSQERRSRLCRAIRRRGWPCSEAWLSRSGAR